MIDDTMDQNMISFAMDVDEWSTVVIKFDKSFMVSELHDLLCHVFMVCMSRFLSFIDHHANDLIEDFYEVLTLFQIEGYPLMLCDFSRMV